MKSLNAFNPDNSKSITGHLLHIGSKNFIHMILLYNKTDLVGSLFIINIKCLSGGPGRTVEGVGKLSLFFQGEGVFLVCQKKNSFSFRDPSIKYLIYP